MNFFAGSKLATPEKVTIWRFWHKQMSKMMAHLKNYHKYNKPLLLCTQKLKLSHKFVVHQAENVASNFYQVVTKTARIIL